jgi:hypothetical protein
VAITDLLASITTLLRNVDLEVKACMYTATEFSTEATNYGLSFTDPDKILFNFIYHFGSVFDNASELQYLLNPEVILNVQGY